MNAGVLKRFLYFDDRREIPFHESFVLFNALKSCYAHPGPACELALTPPKERPGRTDLSRISHAS